MGDFVVRRADGVFAYHLATVVDDGLDDFTEITRGRDLLSVTPQQIALQRALDLPTPRYAHLPLLTDNSGAKLCKRTGAKAVDEIDKHAVLKTIFRALGLPVINEVIAAEDETRWRWAVRHWDMAKVARADVAVDVEGLQGACN